MRAHGSKLIFHVLLPEYMKFVIVHQSTDEEQLGILLSLSKIARAHFLNLIFFSSNSENTYFERIF